MQLQVNANHKGYKDIKAFADSKNKSINDVMNDDQYLEQVVDILYKHMPKMIRWTIKRDKFKTMYLDQRPVLADIFSNVKSK